METFHFYGKMYLYFHTGPGIYYGNIDISEAPEGHDNVTADSKLMLYPGEDVDRGINPKTIVLTEFHVLVLFPERLVRNENGKSYRKF